MMPLEHTCPVYLFILLSFWDTEARQETYWTEVTLSEEDTSMCSIDVATLLFSDFKLFISKYYTNIFMLICLILRYYPTESSATGSSQLA